MAGSVWGGCSAMCVLCTGSSELALVQGLEVCMTSAAVLIAICNNTQCSGVQGARTDPPGPPAAILHPLCFGCRTEHSVL